MKSGRKRTAQLIPRPPNADRSRLNRKSSREVVVAGPTDPTPRVLLRCPYSGFVFSTTRAQWTIWQTTTSKLVAPQDLDRLALHGAFELSRFDLAARGISQTGRNELVEHFKGDERRFRVLKHCSEAMPRACFDGGRAASADSRLGVRYVPPNRVFARED